MRVGVGGVIGYAWGGVFSGGLGESLKLKLHTI
jgi:hypothetical protein